MCGPGGWVRIRINLKNIDDENQRVDRITQYLVGVGSRTDPVLERRLTDWGVLAHEFFHALDYVDGFPPLDPEPESDDPRFASYPDRFGEYVETWVQSMSRAIDAIRTHDRSDGCGTARVQDGIPSGGAGGTRNARSYGHVWAGPRSLEARGP